MIIRQFNYTTKWTLEVLTPHFLKQATVFGLHYFTEYILIDIQKNYKINNDNDLKLYKKAIEELTCLCSNSSALYWSNPQYVQEISNILKPLLTPNLNSYVITSLGVLLSNIENSSLSFIPKFTIERRFVDLKTLSYHEEFYFTQILKKEL